VCPKDNLPHKANCCWAVVVEAGYFQQAEKGANPSLKYAIEKRKIT
jgi:hypothetical protein